MGEIQMNYRLADHADPQRLGDITGKYVKRATGYLQIRENGKLRLSRTARRGLPERDSGG